MKTESLTIIRNARKRKCSHCGALIPAGVQCVRYTYDKTGGPIEYHRRAYWCMDCEHKGMKS